MADRRFMTWLRVTVVAVLAGSAAGAAGETAHTGATVITFEVSATDLAYDSVSGNIYAAITNNNGVRTNQVVAINTQTGRLGESTSLPGIPNKVAVAANGEFLYVGLEETNIVMRLELPSLHTNHVFALEGGTPNSPLFVENMLVLPGNSRAVVIARRKRWNTSPRHEGVAVYDDGIKRSLHTDEHIGSNAIDFGPTEDVLYGASLEGSHFFRMRISSSGVVTERHLLGGVDIFNERGIDYDAGFVYAWLGHVIDPETARTVDRLSFFSSHVKADGGIDRITTLQASDNARTISVLFFEQHARVFLGSQVISNVYGITRALIRWGSDGVAFANSGGRFGFPTPVTVPGRVFLLRSPWLVAGPAADLSIRLQADTALGLVNQDVIYTATVSNAGPYAVSNVLVRHRLPWISLTASKPHSVFSGNIQLPGLAVGETVTLSFACQTNKPFALSNVVWVGSAAADPNLNNNIASVVTPVNFYTQPNQMVEWPGLRVKDIAWDARGQKIYAITPPATGSGVDSLVAIDPARGTVGAPYPLGTNAWRLEASHLGEYLYLLQGTSTVRRFSLPALDSHFQFQSLEELGDIAVAPDNPTRVGISGRGRRVYDNGVALGLSVGSDWADITFGTSSSRLYAVTPSSYLFTYDVTGAGLVLRDQGSLSLFQSSAFFGDGRLYLRDGSVYDAESRAKVGQLALQSSVNYVLPDSAKGLAYSFAYPQLFIHDATRFNIRAVIEPVYSVSFASRIIRWGDDGLALRDSDRLTILRTSHIADLDGDGSSDTWERVYFGSTNAPAALPNHDADGDGLLNWQEFVAGTDPTDAQSALRLHAALENGVVRLRFASTETRYYNIERTSDVSSNLWPTLVRNLPGTGASIAVEDRWPATQQVFYRLKVLD